MRTWPKSLQQIVGTAREFFRRHWQALLRIREKLRLSEETVHLFLAGGVGIIGGLVNLIFHLCIDSIQELALRDRGDLVEIAEALRWWQRLLVPTVGSFAAGLVLFWGLPWAGQRGSTELISPTPPDGSPIPTGFARLTSITLQISHPPTKMVLLHMINAFAACPLIEEIREIDSSSYSHLD